MNSGYRVGDNHEPDAVTHFLVKSGDKEIGEEFHVGTTSFFIDYAQSEYKGCRIGKYPIQDGQTLHPAVLVSE